MKKKLIYVGLVLTVVISIFLHFYNSSQVPPCVNADEVAFGYNAYSLLTTGKDEYGSFLPLRLKSFEDYKLPLYTYLSIPIVAVLGLNDLSIRLLAYLAGIAFVPLMFFLTKEIFEDEKIALIASFLTAVNSGFLILTRHAHEGTIMGFFLILTLITFIKYLKSEKTRYFILTNLFLLLLSYSYQSGRIYLVLFLILQFFYVFWKKTKSATKNKIAKISLLLIISILALYPDFKYGLNRVKNLAFYKDQGFQLRVGEYLGEHSNRIIHNKLTQTIKEIPNRYFAQLSSDFLVAQGDTNYRFGFQNLGLITPVEYILFFVGLYYLFRKNVKYKGILLALFFITPLSNALTWQSPSLIRSFVLFFPLLCIVSYGIYFLLQEFKDKKIKIAFFTGALLLMLFYLYTNLDVYFNHYAKRAVVVRQWQCGYRELASYIKKNYDRFDRFVITDRHGQPYIFLLYYLGIDPKIYQKNAKISEPDRYGFGQIGQFDKFKFNFNYNPSLRKTAFIGYPDEFMGAGLSDKKTKEIRVGTEEIFDIYEVN